MPRNRRLPQLDDSWYSVASNMSNGSHYSDANDVRGDLMASINNNQMNRSNNYNPWLFNGNENSEPSWYGDNILRQREQSSALREFQQPLFGGQRNAQQSQPGFFSRLADGISSINFERMLPAVAEGLGNVNGGGAQRGNANSNSGQIIGQVASNVAEKAGDIVHPVVGTFASSAVTGLTTGLMTGNPVVGVVAGVGSLLLNLFKLPGKIREYNAQKEQEKIAKERAKVEQNRAKFYEEGLKTLGTLRNDNAALRKELETQRNTFNEFIKNYNPGTDTQVYRENNQQQLQIERVSDQVNQQVQNNNTVRRYNDLQIQNVYNLAYNQPAVAPRMQVNKRTQADRFRRGVGLSNFFAPVRAGYL